MYRTLCGLGCCLLLWMYACSSPEVGSVENPQPTDGSVQKDIDPAEVSFLPEMSMDSHSAEQPTSVSESQETTGSADSSVEWWSHEETSQHDGDNSSDMPEEPLISESIQSEPVPDKTSCVTTTSSDLSQVTVWRNVPANLGPQTHTMSACGVHGFRMVGAATAEYEVHVKDFAPNHEMTLTVYNARTTRGVAPDKPLEQVRSQGKGWLVGKFAIDRSGEVSLVLDSRTYPLQATYRIDVFCVRNCHLKATRYPIVLMHGFAGTDKYFGILDYFYQVKPHLDKLGYAVFTPSVQPIANSTQRVFTLKAKIDDILRETGARKLNLIAHSQGGVDGRLLISLHNYGDVVSSLTTISTPHRGIPVPDLLIPPSQELSESNMQLYNQLYPNDARVAYFSYAGVSCGILDAACRKKYNDETIDPLLLVTFNALKSLRGDNDGVVPVSSAKWGTFLGEIPADHWDEVGQLADTNNKSFSHKTFYEKEAQRLQQLDF